MSTGEPYTLERIEAPAAHKIAINLCNNSIETIECQHCTAEFIDKILPQLPQQSSSCTYPSTHNKQRGMVNHQLPLLSSWINPQNGETEYTDTGECTWYFTDRAITSTVQSPHPQEFTNFC